jgi:hypothetical protein
MSYYAGFDLKKDQFVLFDDINNDLYIGDKQIKSLCIKYDINRFKDISSNYFKINQNDFNELISMNQYHIMDNIKSKNKEFLCKYNLEEWII